MTSALPSWTPFEAGAPPAFSEPEARPGRVVALIAGEGALRAGWVGELALGLAEAWGVTAAGRVVTVDAGFHAPSLQRAADLPSGEGLSDLLLWGGSLQRVTRRSARGPLVVTTGTPIADGASVLGTPRWPAVCEGFREAGVLLAVVVPASEPGLDRVVAEASDVVLLAAKEEEASSLLAEGTEKVRGVVGLEEVDTASATPVQDSRAEEEGQALETDGPEPEDPGPTVRSSQPGVLFQPPADPEEGRGAGRRTGWILAVVAFLVIALGAAYRAGYVHVPGFGRGDVTAEAAPGSDLSAVGPADAVPVQAFSVVVGSYEDAAAAADVVASFSESAPDVVFFAEPVFADGRVVHRVLAGPAADSGTAVQLAASLATASEANASGWLVVGTPSAFQLGETRDVDSANRRVEVLSGLGIPAYVLAVDYSDGTVRFRVYAGAFANAEEASSLSHLLQERGLSHADLSRRIGRLP